MEIRRIKYSSTRNAPQGAQTYTGIVELTPAEMNCVAGGMRASTVDVKAVKAK